MIDVIKRDGNREAFSEKKVRASIEAAALEAGIPPGRIGQLVNDASREPLDLAKGTAPVETRTIREKILARLNVLEPSVSDAWLAFDRRNKKIA
jgi:transcriptional regulator NrdR family protein